MAPAGELADPGRPRHARGAAAAEHAEVSAYYIVAEALTNTSRHARASAVSVEVEAVG